MALVHCSRSLKGSQPALLQRTLNARLIHGSRLDAERNGLTFVGGTRENRGSGNISGSEKNFFRLNIGKLDSFLSEAGDKETQKQAQKDLHSLTFLTEDPQLHVRIDFLLTKSVFSRLIFHSPTLIQILRQCEIKRCKQLPSTRNDDTRHTRPLELSCTFSAPLTPQIISEISGNSSLRSFST